jgi:hypothetical protein
LADRIVGDTWEHNGEEVAGPMTDLQKAAKQIGDVAERLAEVADAASGQRSRRRGAVRWVVLPLAGAMAYAAARRGLKGQAARAKDVASEARRTPEQPDSDLLGRVKEVVGVADQLERRREDRAKRRRRRRATSA